MKKKQIFLCRSYYHFYISLINSINYHGLTKILMIESNFDLDKLITIKSNTEKLFENVEIHIINDRESYKDLLKLKYDNIIFFHWTVYKNPEYSFFKLCTNNQLVLIEDGVTHYGVYHKDIKTKKILIKYLLNLILCGRKDLLLNNKVKKGLVTLPDKYPEFLKSKLFELKLPSEINGELGSKILDVFELNKKLIVDSNKKLAIIFTQPLSEDGYMLEDEKINKYENIINKTRNEGYSIILKQHPREQTKYNFKDDIYMIEKDFPGELLNLIGIEFSLAISICSGVVHNVNAKKKIQTEPDFFSV
ncbi:polysialyltransferase family glycosyltransferase [Bacillus sp. UMB0893]|uniref:polysialyltransferase family glycosyltransferase n=1 Tax=Bacillus sp. UMB0893 TaxID=2066053 RepID=UPI000C78D831|nr:polysialyltransferase family glycosyltransferase [Bacillus sp. UMB0893]PLR67926.1 hypothetical protein CYJ36_11445 [Bacillus sp. UMB0893]